MFGKVGPNKQMYVLIRKCMFKKVGPNMKMVVLIRKWMFGKDGRKKIISFITSHDFSSSISTTKMMLQMMSGTCPFFRR